MRRFPVPQWRASAGRASAERLIREIKLSKEVLGEVFDSAEMRKKLQGRGTKPIIPNRRDRSTETQRKPLYGFDLGNGRRILWCCIEGTSGDLSLA